MTLFPEFIDSFYRKVTFSSTKTRLFQGFSPFTRLATLASYLPTSRQTKSEVSYTTKTSEKWQKNTPGDRDSSPDMEIERDHKPIVIRNSTDLQRLKLEKLMKNPEKEVIIPERPKERGVPVVPDFVRNVMGSSAGAGSGEFHVYRHLRRKEYARQRYMKEKGEREKLDNEYHAKLEENKKKAEERTAKKRQKRLKRKQKMKKKPKLGSKSSQSEATESSSSEEVESEECEKKNEEQISDDSKPKNEQETEDNKSKEDEPKETEDKNEETK